MLYKTGSILSAAVVPGELFVVAALRPTKESFLFFLMIMWEFPTPWLSSLTDASKEDTRY